MLQLLLLRVFIFLECIEQNIIKQAVRVATQYASAPASWQYLRIYSPGGTCSSMLAV